jgi:hypothetical protein
MKVARKAFLPLVLLLLSYWTTGSAFADAGVFSGDGYNLRQISSKSIHLVRIDVTISLGEDANPSDSELRGLSPKEAEEARSFDVSYRCIFVLRSLSNKQEEVQVGFPVDSETADSEKELFESYDFHARDNNQAYRVQLGESGSENTFTWKMKFAPGETKTLTVSYVIPFSGGLGSTSRSVMNIGKAGPPTTAEREKFRAREAIGAFRNAQLDGALINETEYITSTGSSWAGNVESATFTLLTERFERFLDRAGLPENATKPHSEDGTEYPAPFPVRHPWWFRTISPGGWTQVQGGVQWNYKDYKPTDPIEVHYFQSVLPKWPAEVDAFVDHFLKALKPEDSPQAELTRVRDVILATYGAEPADPITKEFVEDQLWYAPRKNFTMADLTPEQKAVIEKLDARIAKAKAAESAHP